MCIRDRLDIVNNNVDALDTQASHALYSIHDVAADSLSELVDGHAVLSGDGNLDASGALCYLYVYALADVLGSTERLANIADHAGAAATQGIHAGNLAGCDAGNLGDHDIIDGGGAVLGFQVVIDLALLGSRNLVVGILCRGLVSVSYTHLTLPTIYSV